MGRETDTRSSGGTLVEQIASIMLTNRPHEDPAFTTPRPEQEQEIILNKSSYQHELLCPLFDFLFKWFLEDGKLHSLRHDDVLVENRQCLIRPLEDIRARSAVERREIEGNLMKEGQ